MGHVVDLFKDFGEAKVVLDDGFLFGIHERQADEEMEIWARPKNENIFKCLEIKLHLNFIYLSVQMTSHSLITSVKGNSLLNQIRSHLKQKYRFPESLASR